MNADDIHKFLDKKYEFSQAYLFHEMRIGTGWGKDAERYMDVWMIHPAMTKGIIRVYEIKVSASDFYRELKKPGKRRPALMLCNEFYFAAPKGVIPVDKVPPECGLIEFDEDGKYVLTLKAPWRDIAGPPWRFVAALARRAKRNSGHRGMEE